MAVDRGRFLGDLSGALADLGILIPIVTALVLIAGIDPGTVFIGVGALYLGAGHYFRVPMPVQPVKAAAAIVIANGLPATQLAAAGIVLGLVLLVVALTGLADQLARAFAPPIIRGLQLGVGLLLLSTAWRIPAYGDVVSVLVVIAVAGSMLHQSRRDRPIPVAAIAVAGGIFVALMLGAQPSIPAFSGGIWRPTIDASVFDPGVLWTALVVLVIPQVPLTFGNAVVGIVDVQRRRFGAAADRVRPRAVGTSMGVANIAVGALGGMPMCHGAGGFTAHVRAGATSARMNFIIGMPMLVGGLLFGSTLLALLSLIPLAVLAGLLVFTAVTHALLASDQRGADLAVAVLVGIVGFATENLAWGLAAGMLLHHGGRLMLPRPAPPRPPTPGAS